MYVYLVSPLLLLLIADALLLVQAEIPSVPCTSSHRPADFGTLDDKWTIDRKNITPTPLPEPPTALDWGGGYCARDRRIQNKAWRWPNGSLAQGRGKCFNLRTWLKRPITGKCLTYVETKDDADAVQEALMVKRGQAAYLSNHGLYHGAIEIKGKAAPMTQKAAGGKIAGKLAVSIVDKAMKGQINLFNDDEPLAPAYQHVALTGDELVCNPFGETAGSINFFVPYGLYSLYEVKKDGDSITFRSRERENPSVIAVTRFVENNEEVTAVGFDVTVFGSGLTYCMIRRTSIFYGDTWYKYNNKDIDVARKQNIPKLSPSKNYFFAYGPSSEANLMRDYCNYNAQLKTRGFVYGPVEPMSQSEYERMVDDNVLDGA